ncbi:ABC transporter permease [Spiroplasma sabaudiense Ar-1343]|uniref:ABC transporter permease n=1 Tax=Spiroplasma sabaudiense Ar-1343 TaxID=1276257 RepID=W6AAY3_9MOLU|nr:ABC transporter permease [Spiroplasma sabaudiense]AHI54015.1 ABC transporter permease [Spiroplasma sabaudiense Ar-1343]
MKKIIKSYLKTFFNAWIETVGSIIFTILLALISIGLMAPSVQIMSRINNVERNTNKWDFEMDNDYNYLSAEIVFKYFYSHEDFQVNDNFILKIENDSFSFFTPEYYKALHHQIGVGDIDRPLKMEEIETNRIYVDILNATLNVLMNSENGLQTSSQIKKINSSSSLTYFDIFTFDFQKMLGKDSGNFGSVQLYLQRQIFESIAKENQAVIDYKPKIYFEEKPMLNSRGRSIEVRKIIEDSKAELNNVVLIDGHMPNSNAVIPEILITDLFAKSNGLKIGDVIKLPLGFSNGLMHDVEFRISGFGSNLESLVTGENFLSSWKTSQNYFFAFLDETAFDEIYYNFYENQTTKALTLQTQTLIKLKDPNFNIEKLFINESQGTTVFNNSEKIMFSIKESFFHETLSITKIQAILFILIAVILLLLSFIFTNFLIRKEINDSLKQLGIFKASGYSNFQLAWVFAIKVTISIFIGILIGFFISFPIQIYVLALFENQIIFFVNPILYSLWFLALILILIPLSLMLMSYLLISFFLGKPVLYLINNTARIKEPSKFSTTMAYIIFPIFICQFISQKINHYLSSKSIGFNYRLRTAFTQRSKGKFITTIFLFSLASMLFLFQLGSQSLIEQNYNRYTNPYNQNLSHFYRFNSQPNVVWNQEDGFKIEEEDDFIDNPIKYIGYQNSNFNEVVNQNSNDFETKISLLTSLVTEAIKSNSENLVTDMMIVNGTSPDAWENFGPSMTKFLKTDLTAIESTDSFESLPQIGNAADFKKTALFYSQQNSDEKNSTFRLSDFKAISQLAFAQSSGLSYANEAYENLVAQGIENKIAIEIVRKGIDELISIQDFQSFDISNKVVGSLMRQSQKNIDFQIGNLPEMTRILFEAAFSAPTNSSTLITSNQIFYNETTELLSYSFSVKPLMKPNLDLANLELIDFGDDKVDLQTAWRMRLTKADTLKNMSNQLFDNPFETKVIISQLFAKKYDLKIGDSFLIAPKTRPGLTGINRVKVVDINLANTYTDTIFADYNSFFKVNSNGILNPEDENHLILKNRLFSQMELYNGEIDTNNFADTFLNLELNANSLAVRYDFGTPILGFWFKEILPLEQLFETDDSLLRTPSFLTNPSLTNRLSNSNVAYLRLTRVFAKDLMSQISSMMLILIILSSILLIILFVVIMSIVIDTSRNIIFTMKAFGYRNSEVNWIVIGNYVIYSLVAFMISYLFSLIVWRVVLDIAWSSSQILMEFPWSFWAPLVTFLALGFVCFFGWLVAQIKVKRESIVNNLE